MLQFTRLEKLSIYKHSSLLGPFVSYKENEELWIQALAPERLAKDKHSSLFWNFVNDEGEKFFLRFEPDGDDASDDTKARVVDGPVPSVILEGVVDLGPML